MVGVDHFQSGRGQKFYDQVFDWKMSAMDMPGMDYTVIETGSEPGGGIMAIPEPGIPTAWTVYIGTDDIEATCRKIEENSGKVHKPPMEVPGVGRFAIACDPQGAFFGLWEGKKE